MVFAFKQIQLVVDIAFVVLMAKDEGKLTNTDQTKNSVTLKINKRKVNCTVLHTCLPRTVAFTKLIAGYVPQLCYFFFAQKCPFWNFLQSIAMKLGVKPCSQMWDYRLWVNFTNDPQRRTRKCVPRNRETWKMFCIHKEEQPIGHSLKRTWIISSQWGGLLLEHISWKANFKQNSI